jgi:16S rRNA G527 N7-methylase RsmG
VQLKPQQIDWLSASLGRAVTGDERAAFGAVLDLLAKWNTRSGLTNLADPNEVVIRHLCDSALAARLLWASPGGGSAGDVPRGTDAPAQALRLVDVGPGGGFPGIVVALLAQGYGAGAVHLTFIEAQARRVSFLKTLLREVGVAGEALHGRLEDDGRITLEGAKPGVPADRGAPFDIALSRAVFAPAEWLRRASLGPLAREVVVFVAQEPLPDGPLRLSSDADLPLQAGHRRLGLYRIVS